MDGAAEPVVRLLALCNYPSPGRPAHQPFVRATLLALAALGTRVSVIAPEPLWHRLRARSGFRLAPRVESPDGLPVERPRYLSWSGWAWRAGGRTRCLTVGAYVRAARHAARAPGAVDVCLGHFLYPHGVGAAEIAARLGVPAVLSLGESRFLAYERTFRRADLAAALNRFHAVVANSPAIAETCISRYGLSASRVRVLPNGVDLTRFAPGDRAAARARCRLPPDRPIVAFVGQLVPRKGPERVLEAIRRRPDIGVVFLGEGPAALGGAQVLHRGPVPHDEMPHWLRAADLFALPTLAEGCCNAILEALASGLPVVSSDRAFNHGILDASVGVLVEPSDVAALGAAIARLVDQPALRRAMAAAARRRAESFDLGARARDLLGVLRSACAAAAARGAPGMPPALVASRGAPG
jgi:glycosyltransferase involved in cell wall biosynthesis